MSPQFHVDSKYGGGSALSHPMLGVLALSALLVSGCGFFGGSSDGHDEVPEGYTQASTQWVSFAYPQTWEKLPDAYPDGWPIAFGGPSGGTRYAEVAVFVQLPATTDPVLAVGWAPQLANTQ